MTRPSHSAGRQSIPESYPRFPSLLHMLQAAIDQRPQHSAVVCRDASICYSELGHAVAGVADGLRVSKGDRVLILIPNSIETVVAFYAAMAAGCQAVPMNPFFTPGELDKLVAKLGPTAILCVGSTADTAKRLSDKFSVPQVIDFSEPALSIDAFAEAAPQGLRDVHFPGPDDLALLVFTGGTTGVPKGVNHHHRNLVASALLHSTVWPVRAGAEVILNVAPLFHIWGLGYGVLSSAFAQGTFVLVPKFDADEVLEAIERHAVTIFGGGPAPIYNGLLGSPKAAETDYSSLRYCLSGGAPCPAELHRRWQALTDCPLFEGWGMSEGAPFCLNPAEGERKLMSVGLPVPETEIEIVDLETGDEVLPLGESGEVRVRGPQVMSGYREEPEETAMALRNGWLYTGDIGYIDEDGYLFLVDRKKDMVIVGGYNVYPREVDEVLADHPQIREASAVGRPDERLGEVIVAFVVTNAGEELGETELLDYCRENLVKYKRPVEVHFIDQLPRTAANKIDKITLRRMAAEGGG